MPELKNQESQKFNVLIVEDNDLQSRYLTRILTNEFHEKLNITCANTGLNAIEKIFSEAETNLLISDCELDPHRQTVSSQPIPPDITRIINYFKTRELCDLNLLQHINSISKTLHKRTLSSLLVETIRQGLLDVSNGFNIATLTRLLINEKIEIVMMSANAKNKEKSAINGFKNFFVKSRENFPAMMGTIEKILNTQGF